MPKPSLIHSASRAALLRGRTLRSHAVLLVLVAQLNTAQGIICNLRDVSHISVVAAEHAGDGDVDFSHDHASFPADPTDPLDFNAHCLHISCVHSPAFAASPIAHEFNSTISTAPTSGPRLHMPMPAPSHCRCRTPILLASKQ